LFPKESKQGNIQGTWCFHININFPVCRRLYTEAVV
jgi:hypothetical protein